MTAENPVPHRVFISPSLPGRKSMTVDSADKILRHPQIKLLPDWVIDEARAVQKSGEMWWDPINENRKENQ